MSIVFGTKFKGGVVPHIEIDKRMVKKLFKERYQ